MWGGPVGGPAWESVWDTAASGGTVSLQTWCLWEGTAHLPEGPHGAMEGRLTLLCACPPADVL